MLELTSELGPSHQFTLSEEERVTRREGRPPLHLDGLIEIPQPAVMPLTEALIGEDKELAAFWAAEKNQYRYDYVALACSFIPAKDQPFSKAWFEIGLNHEGVGDGPVAWSMAPREVIDAAKVTQSGTIGSEFKLLSAEVKETVEQQAREWFLRAFRERTARPYWEFRHTKQSPIEGSWRLHMVVRSPVGSAGEGQVKLRAVVDKRTFLIFRKDQPVDEPATVTFTLPRAD